MSIDNVEDISPRVQYVALAAQTEFAYPFPVFQDADLVVDVDGVTQTLTTHYAVTGEGEDTGGEVTFVTPMTGGEIVTIYRDIAIERTTDFQQNGPLASASFNDELDRITLILQQLESRIGRSLRLPITAEATDAQTQLSPIANWLSRYVTINANGIPEPATLVSGTISQSVIGALLHPQTTEEQALNIVPLNQQYTANPYDVRRYGAVGDGVTNDAPAFQRAINLAKRYGGTVIVPMPPVAYLLENPLDCTTDNLASLAPIRGWTFRCEANVIAATQNPPYYPAIIAKHTGHVFDLSGAFGVNFENVTVGTDTITFPTTCFFLARNSDGSSQIHRFTNCRVLGQFSKAVYYNYGSEDDILNGCVFYNFQGGAAKVCIWTGNNIESLSSTFITIATGVQSAINHRVFGGEFFCASNNAAADVFEFESIRSIRLFGPWMGCRAGGSGGRSLIYVNTTNGPTDLVTLIGVTGEAGDEPSYGIYLGDGVATCSSWTVLSCTLPNATNMIRAHANVTCAAFQLIDVTNQSLGGGVNILGTLTGSFAWNVSGGVTAGTLTENNIDVLNKIFARAGEVNITLRDATADADEKNYRIRCVGGLLVISATNDALNANTNPVVINRTGTTIDTITLTSAQYLLSALPGSYADDSVASAAGVPVGGLYRNGSAVQWRVS